MESRHRARSHFVLSEPLLFESGARGRRGFDVPALDIPEKELHDLLPPALLREGLDGMPELSESEVVRHFTRLSTWNYCIDLGLYPLGSCTMKYNPRLNEHVARFDGFTRGHPYLPVEWMQGALHIEKTLEDCLAEITGMDAVTLQPAAGAHGELTGLLMIRAYHETQGRARKKILIPDSAHGTNPASVTISGYVVEKVRSNARGTLEVEHLAALVDDEVAGVMITNPNTLGIFEDQIEGITELMHAKGGLVYMDGANLNAMMGVTRPGDFGIDVLHLNLHKTFTTPHGGGGPGSGPVAVTERLEPFLPNPRIVRGDDDSYTLDRDRPQSIGKVKVFNGQFGMHVRALAYILASGSAGLREASEVAVLNANYLRKKLEGRYALPYDTATLHEVVFSDRLQRKNDVRVTDIAKRLMDYGFHPPTISFPLIVPGALMIEPTETESQQELDAFASAMLAIADEAEQDPERVRTAPHMTCVGRVDEVAAARHPVLRWTSDADAGTRSQEPG